MYQENKRERRIVAFFTIIAGLPGLVAPFLIISAFFTSRNSVTHQILSLKFILLTLIAFVLRGICGVLGGVLVWQGRKIGYKLATIMWSYLVWAGVYSLYRLYMQQSVSYLLEVEIIGRSKVIAKSLGKIIFGIPILYSLWNRIRYGIENKA